LKAAARGYPGALRELAWLREAAGDRVGAEALYRQAVEWGNATGLGDLARLRERAGDWAGADRIRRFGLTGAGAIAARLDFGE
jgi:hypothetical protein